MVLPRQSLECTRTPLNSSVSPWPRKHPKNGFTHRVDVATTFIRRGWCRWVDRHEAVDHGRPKPRNQRQIDFLRSTAGNQLLTFYEFPRAMWKSIRTTNALENLNREFRRRTKTQASFSSEESAVALLFGLIASGQIQLRRIDGYQRLSEVLEHAEVAA